MAGSDAFEPYVIRPGDYLRHLTFVHGFEEKAVIDHPKNQDLWKAGSSPWQLQPGEILYVPVRRSPTGPVRIAGENDFSGAVPKVWIHVTFRRESGAPLKDEPCSVLGVDPPLALKTDGDGTLAFEVPVTAREVVVEFYLAGYGHRLAVGHLDPVTSSSGEVGRLSNLGVLWELPDDAAAFFLERGCPYEELPRTDPGAARLAVLPAGSAQEACAESMSATIRKELVVRHKV